MKKRNWGKRVSVSKPDERLLRAEAVLDRLIGLGGMGLLRRDKEDVRRIPEGYPKDVRVRKGCLGGIVADCRITRIVV